MNTHISLSARAFSRHCSLAASLTLAVLAAGCSFLKPAQNETRYYLLTPMPSIVAATRANASLPACTLRLRLVELADYLRTQDMAVRTGANEIRFALFHRWAEPLDSGVRRVLGENLRVAPGVRDVLTDEPTPAGRPVYTISIHVLACEGTDTNKIGSAIFEARWEIVGSGSQQSVLRHGVFRAQNSAWTTGDYGQLASQISRALAEFSNVLLKALSQQVR